MIKTYLSVTYEQRLQVKALGAKWDPARRQWYVPDGTALEPFSAWLPAGHTVNAALMAQNHRPATVPAISTKGIGLSELLAGLADAVKRAHGGGAVWVRVEVTNVRLARGSVFLEFTELGPGGIAVAQARGVIWQTTAEQIIPAFETATGVMLAAGIKLLVKARPNLHPQYGLNLVVEEIDHEYTVGDLEVKRRNIRARLQQQGIYEANRQLETPWDFRAVLVLAPHQAAGLGDFQAEALRLETAGVCQFTYVTSRFQGDGATKEMCAALANALELWLKTHLDLPDAVVIIRGGGAVNDLAWLNDHQLAQAICELPIPVFTGIGHERDETTPDEVAHTRFDTPSKVIAGIEQAIATRSRNANSAFKAIMAMAEHVTAQCSGNTDRAHSALQIDASRHLVVAKNTSAKLMQDIESIARQGIQTKRTEKNNQMASMREITTRQIATTQGQIPRMVADVVQQAWETLKDTRSETNAILKTTLEMAAAKILHERTNLNTAFADISKEAKRTVNMASSNSEALIREITGQGPEKTLRRGFAVVRSKDGVPLTNANSIHDGQAIQIQFKDGTVQAITQYSTREIP